MIFFLAYLYVTKTQFGGSSIMAPNSSLSEPWQKSAIPDLMNESINEKIMVSKFFVLHKNKILCSKLLRVRILMFYPLSYLQTNKTSHKNNVTFKYLCCDAHNCIKSKSHVDVENINQKEKISKSRIYYFLMNVYSFVILYYTFYMYVPVHYTVNHSRYLGN